MPCGGNDGKQYLRIYKTQPDKMKHAFLLLTHFSPEKTYDLVRRLTSPEHYIVIHFDKKTNIDQADPYFVKLKQNLNTTVLSDRVDVQWGGYRIINADLNMMREALKHKDVGYMHLITGQCMPAKSMMYIHDFFEKNNGTEYIETALMPQTADHGLTYKRVNNYHLHDFFNPRSKKARDVFFKNVNTAFRKLQGALKMIGIYRRYPSRYIPVYTGSAWWSLSYAACKYVVDYVDAHKDFHRRFRYTQFVDEMFIQTVIMSSPFKDKVVNYNLRYIDFPHGQSSPEDLTMKHVPELNKPDVIFARKFTDKSKELIDYLDKKVY